MKAMTVKRPIGKKGISGLSDRNAGLLVTSEKVPKAKSEKKGLAIKTAPEKAASTRRGGKSPASGETGG